jgi:hypothetical protein
VPSWIEKLGSPKLKPKLKFGPKRRWNWSRSCWLKLKPFGPGPLSWFVLPGAGAAAVRRSGR